ncbi:cadmium-induced protein AS8 [Tripterygium wilfordii]|uniref:Cadmium-induced protein AS8 n=1 Tax=Tripterygium wilfordii TaxID=458696 RepID=A0A7J7CP12_TRIWF|nr:cadmium-induced protein AS8 [Tripterygium wilfordii]
MEPCASNFWSFWSMRIAIGCGVWWGSVFGPVVIGYFGAGCGVGFSMGFTLVGIGIGLPADFVFEVPYNARSGALEFSQSNHLLSARNVARGGWKNIASRIAVLQREARGRFLSVKENNLFGHMTSILPIHAMSISKGCERFGSYIFPKKDATCNVDLFSPKMGINDLWSYHLQAPSEEDSFDKAVFAG